MDWLVTFLIVCRSALLTLLIVTTLTQIKRDKGNNKWYSLLFIVILLVIDL